MAVVKLNKAIEVVRLGEEEDAPVFYIDMTDKAITENVVALREKFSAYIKEVEEIRPEDGLTEETSEILVKTFKDIVETMMGEGAFETVVNYVADGQNFSAADMVIIMSPLFMHLQGLINGVFAKRGEDARAKYHAV